MATGKKAGDGMLISETQFAELTECAICLASWTDPVIIPCAHIYCEGCLKGIDKCPLCRATFAADSIKKFTFYGQLLQTIEAAKSGAVRPQSTCICLLNDIKLLALLNIY